MSLSVAPEDGETEIFGKYVAELQNDDVIVDDDGFSGTLNYVTGYTGFSDDPGLQEGLFLAVKVTADAGAVVKAGLEPSAGSGLVTLDSDMNIVVHIEDTNKQKFKVVSTKDGTTLERTFDLSGLHI